MQVFADIASPLHEGTSENYRFNWTPDMTLAFKNLKKALMRSPVLYFPYLALPFILETDARSKAVVAVLAQKGEDGMVHPIQFAIRTMNVAELN